MNRILPLPDWDVGRFFLVAASSNAGKEWEALARRNPEAARRAFERLSWYPLVRQARRQFPLRGKALQPFWELEVTSSERIWYAVDEAGLTVIVAARNDVHDSSRLIQILNKRRAAYESAVAFANKFALLHQSDVLRVPEWAEAPAMMEAPVPSLLKKQEP